MVLAAEGHCKYPLTNPSYVCNCNVIAFVWSKDLQDMKNTD